MPARIYPSNAPRGGSTTLTGGGSTNDIFPFYLAQAQLAAPLSYTFSAPSTAGGQLVGGTTYYYVVTATNSQGESLQGAEQSYTPPSGTSTNQVTLGWTQVKDASGYKIYRSTTSGSYGASSLLTTIGSGSTVSYADTGTVGAGQPPASNTSAYPTNRACGVVQVQNQSGGTIYVFGSPDLGSQVAATQGDQAVGNGASFTSGEPWAWCAIYGAAGKTVNGGTAAGILVFCDVT
jgi:hypothetical protein